jgi:non-specific serine/threonine protein kinase
LDASDILDLLTHLVDKSLVVAEDRRTVRRYRLLETIRQYARERLVEAGELVGVQRRHRDWYLDFAERADGHLQGPDEAVWLRSLREEHENLRAALAWTAQNNGDAETLCRFAIALGRFRYLHGHWSEARAGVEELLKRNDLPPRAVRELLGEAAHLSWRQGEYEQATALCKKGLAECDRVGDMAGVAYFLFTLGIVALHRGDAQGAKQLLENAAALSWERGDKSRMGAATNQLGVVARIRGEYEVAACHFAEALAVGKALGDLHRIASSLHNLGLVALLRDDYDQAAQLLKESIDACGQISDRWVTQECLEGLAGIACAEGNYSRGARLLGMAEELRVSLASFRLAADQTAFDQRVSCAQTALSAAAFAAAWAEGRAMTLEQAIEYALAPDVH